MNTGRKKTPRIPDIAESVFDVGYLLFDLVAGGIFLAGAHGRVLFIQYGILTLILCGGDAFHLIPRVIRAWRGDSDRIRYALGLGLQISSITMTIFYVLLFYIWKTTFPGLEAPMGIGGVIWVTALVRIGVCLLPQNNWYTGEGNASLSKIRNSVFTVTGVCVVILYIISGNMYDYHLSRMAAAILISFGCYIPVTIWSKKKPMIGMLMIPKTCAYIWIIVMGLQLM